MYGFNDDRSKVNAEDVLATNWKNGSQTGSVRTSGSKTEDSNYTIGQYAVAEGIGTKASGNWSHAEGYQTEAKGYVSHAEGGDAIASGSRSHAEGDSTEANGNTSHAEGDSTKTNGYASHSEGYGTIASGKYSHVQGKYNIEDPSAYTKTTDTSVVSGKTYYILNDTRFYKVLSPTTGELSNYYEYAPAAANQAFIIGNGASNSSRSNALTVDWDGNIELALDTTAASGTTDGDLYAAITALGWQNDVID